jgi:hypothetical protein
MVQTDIINRMLIITDYRRILNNVLFWNLLMWLLKPINNILSDYFMRLPLYLDTTKPT